MGGGLLRPPPIIEIGIIVRHVKVRRCARNIPPGGKAVSDAANDAKGVCLFIG